MLLKISLKILLINFGRMKNMWVHGVKLSGVHTNEMLFEIANHGSRDWTDREGIAYLYNEDGYADIIATKKLSGST
ncbi:hypothetical protein NXV95_06935 [Bacteroides fragilis]|nr:hypothetical protein [Bacteroides fragilis]